VLGERWRKVVDCGCPLFFAFNSDDANEFANSDANAFANSVANKDGEVGSDSCIEEGVLLFDSDDANTVVIEDVKASVNADTNDDCRVIEVRLIWLLEGGVRDC
jgi:hypothetical protein